MSSSYLLLGMRRVEFPAYEGAHLEPSLYRVLIANPVREHLDEMAKGMDLAKGTVAGHALAFLISQVETKKVHRILELRKSLVGKWGNRARTEGVTAPGPILDWMRKAMLAMDLEDRVIVETAIEAYYDVWPKKKDKRSVLKPHLVETPKKRSRSSAA